MRNQAPKSRWKGLTSRFMLFSLIWCSLTDASLSSWLVGGPAVLLAVTASIFLLPPTHLSWAGVLRFTPFFLIRSLLGAVDVAWRALHPRMPIKPDFVLFPLRLEGELPRVLTVNVASLLPGTLSAEVEQNMLRIHVLDSSNDVISELVEVEEHVARIFGIESLNPEGGERNEAV